MKEESLMRRTIVRRSFAVTLSNRSRWAGLCKHRRRSGKDSVREKTIQGRVPGPVRSQRHGKGKGNARTREVHVNRPDVACKMIAYFY